MDKVFTYQMFTLNCRHILNRKSTVLKSIIFIFWRHVFKLRYFFKFFFLSKSLGTEETGPCVDNVTLGYVVAIVLPSCVNTIRAECPRLGVVNRNY